MKAKYIISLTAAIVTTAITAQTNQTREVSTFNKIDASGATSIIYRQSDTLSVVVNGEAADLEKIETKVSDNTLYIKTKGNIKSSVKIRINGNNLNSVSLSGASSFKTSGVLKTDSLYFETAGASNVNIDVVARSLNTNASGASEVNLSGTTQNLKADVSGASSLKAYKLIAENVSITASGASTAKVFSNSKLSANATGASTIKFKGEPKEVSAEGSTSSQIIKIASDDSQKKMNGNDSTSTSFNWGNKKIIISDSESKKDSILEVRRKNRKFRHWNGLFMGVNGYTDANQNFSLSKPYNYMELDYTRSFNWQLNLFQKNIHIYKNYINLVTGIGFDFNRYQFENKVKLNADSSFAWGNVDSTNTFSYKKNRLTTYYITAPLLLDFNTSSNPKRAFHISAGVVGKYLLGARTRQELHRNGEEYNVTRNDSYNLNPFQLNAYASIGYSGFTIYAQYGLNELFKHNKGPELYPFSVGIRLLGFN